MVTLTRALLADLYSHLFQEPLPPRFLFGIRGGIPSSPGSLTIVPQTQQIDHYDDTIGYMADGHGRAFTGSVDPGLYFTRHPEVQQGCAHVIEGRYSFRKGSHKIEPRAWKGIDVHCWRDKDRDGREDFDERRVFVVHASIDLHYGGQNTVGEYSAGCQIVRKPNWETYRDLTYQLFGDIAEYWLINYHAVIEAQNNQPSPSVTVNKVPIPRTVPFWMSEDLHLVTIARDFLAHLQVDGKPPAMEFQANPPSLSVSPGNRVVAGKIVDGRLVCEVAALLRALDPAVQIQWHPAQKQVEVASSHLSESAPTPQAVDQLAEANDDAPVPDAG